MTNNVTVAIIDYPSALQSAVQGLKEMLVMANKIAREQGVNQQFIAESISPKSKQLTQIAQADIIIIPPSLDPDYYHCPEARLLTALIKAHQQGAILSSACAGAFIIARTGLLDSRTATTHWMLADNFKEQFPDVILKIESLLINDGDIITAGGLMSWIDLGLEIVAQFTKPQVMRALGKYLIVDTGKREQRYYQSFIPKFNHGNQAIINTQHYIQANYSQSLCIGKLAELACMSERTFLRHFFTATSVKPLHYIQRIRVQKACEHLESGGMSFEQISLIVGYDDVNTFRKLFIKILGLTPKAFKTRFV